MDIKEIDDEDDDQDNNSNDKGDDQAAEGQGAEIQGAEAQGDEAPEPEAKEPADEVNPNEGLDAKPSVMDGVKDMEANDPLIANEAEEEESEDEVYSHAQQLVFTYEQQLDSGDKIVFEEQDLVDISVKTVEEENEPPEEPPQQGNTRHSLRPSRQLNYNYRYNHQTFLQSAEALLATEFNPQAFHHLVCGYVMNQMTAKQGIKKHGQVAVKALLKEFAQLDNKGVFAPINSTKLTKEQKHQALQTINMIKEKLCGTIKGQSCADGQMQRALYKKHEMASPTLVNDALMLSLIVDA